MATSPLQSEKKRQDAAYARAQDAIATARASGASDLTLSGDDFSDLAVLPPDIGSLTALSSLDLWGTPVSDISVLSGLTALRVLDLTGTQVSDLSPVLPLTQLADAPQSAGLAFKNTAADPRITEIAEIGDAAKRVTDLFAYLSEFPKGVARLIDKLDTRVGTTQQDVTELETRVSTAIERLDGFDADYESRLDAAAAAFRETNALKAPVVLWQEKETKHQAESAAARTFFIWSLIATGFLVIVLALFLIFSKDVAYALVAPIGCDPAKPETCSGFSARGLSILTLVAAFSPVCFGMSVCR